MGLQLTYNSANCAVGWTFVTGMALHFACDKHSNWRRKDVSLQVIVHLRERTGKEPRQELEAEIMENTAVDLFFIACVTTLLSPGPLVQG